MNYSYGINYSKFPEKEIESMKLDTLRSLSLDVNYIREQLQRIADTLEKTDNKIKEEVLNKVKQDLEE